MQTIENIYVGGEFITSSGNGTIDVISPHTEQVIARVPDGTKEDIDKAVAAARKAFDTGPWPQLSPQERAGYITALSQLIQSRMDEWAGVISQEMGSPFSFSPDGPDLREHDGARLLRRPRRHLPLRGGAQRRHGTGAGAPRAGRRRRRDRPVERPAVHHGPQARPRAAGRLHRRAQARAGDPARRLPARRGLRGDRPAQGRHQHRRRRPRGRRAPGHPPRRRQDRLHRLHRRRQEDRRASRRPAQAGHPRARRQVRVDLPARRRPVLSPYRRLLAPAS